MFGIDIFIKGRRKIMCILTIPTNQIYTFQPKNRGHTLNLVLHAMHSDSILHKN